MKHLYIKTMLLAAGLLFGGALAAFASPQSADDADGELIYTYGDRDEYYGTGEVGVYEVAIRLNNPDLVGAKVCGLRIPMRSSQGISGLRGWLTRELKLATVDGRRVTQPDVASVDLQPKAGFVEVRFDEPYELTADGLYAGYSFFVDESSEELLTTQPIAVAHVRDNDGFYIHTSRTFRLWTNFAQSYSYFGCLALQVILSGGPLEADAARCVSARPCYAVVGEQPVVELTVANRGTRGIESLQFSYEIDGTKGQADVQLPLAVPAVFDRQETVTFALPPVDSEGTSEVHYQLTGVNGQPNGATTGTDGQTSVAVFASLPRHRAILEEYTGLWCAYCPRGAVALEEMKRRHPDDFIGISYHAGHPSIDFSTYDYEPLQFTTDFPNTVDHYPTSWLDRMYETDPFCGVSTYRTFGIEELWLERCKAFAPAWVDLAVTLSDDQKVITAESTLNFVIDAPQHPYRLAYLLVADSLYDESWLQNNAYTADAGWPEYMNEYVAGGQMMHVVHRDICIARSSRDGLEGSLPADITANEPVSHTWQISLDDVVNRSGEPIVQDARKLHVVVLLIDSTTGEVVNARQAHPGESTGIAPLEHRVAFTPVSFDLLGRRVGHSAPGIRFVRSADGTVRKYLSAPASNR